MSVLHLRAAETGPAWPLAGAAAPLRRGEAPTPGVSGHLSAFTEHRLEPLVLDTQQLSISILVRVSAFVF